MNGTWGAVDGGAFNINRYQPRGNICRADYTGWLLHRRSRHASSDVGIIHGSEGNSPREQRATRDWNAQPNWNSVVPPSRPVPQIWNTHTHTYKPGLSCVSPSTCIQLRRCCIVKLIWRTTKYQRLNVNRATLLLRDSSLAFAWIFTFFWNYIIVSLLERNHLEKEWLFRDKER